MTPPTPEDTHDDRERLQVTRREIERLNTLRQDVASGLLAVSETAKRDAEKLLSAITERPASVRDPEPPAAVLGGESRRSGWSSPHLYGAFALGLISGLLVAALMRSASPSPPASESADGADIVGLSEQQPAAATAPSPPDPVAPVEADPVQVETLVVPDVADDAPQGDRLVLTLTTRGPCWLRSSVDDAEPVERLLPPNRTVVLEVEQEALLRIGDAAAMSLLINNQPTRPLGREGQAISLRITPANYTDFLVDAPGR